MARRGYECSGIAIACPLSPRHRRAERACRPISSSPARRPFNRGRHEESVDEEESVPEHVVKLRLYRRQHSAGKNDSGSQTLDLRILERRTHPTEAEEKQKGTPLSGLVRCRANMPPGVRDRTHGVSGSGVSRLSGGAALFAVSAPSITAATSLTQRIGTVPVHPREARPREFRCALKLDAVLSTRPKRKKEGAP